MLRQLWRDEEASVMTAEVVLLATILVIGITVGAKSMRDAVVSEWADYAQAIANLDQSYNIPDRYDATAGTTFYGSHFVDTRDFCDTASVSTPWTDPETGVTYGVPPAGEQ